MLAAQMPANRGAPQLPHTPPTTKGKLWPRVAATRWFLSDSTLSAPVPANEGADAVGVGASHATEHRTWVFPKWHLGKWNDYNLGVTLALSL